MPILLTLALSTLLASEEVPTQYLDSSGDAIPAVSTEVRKHVAPKMPGAARGFDGVCRIRIFIDERGKPYEAQPQAECPEVYRKDASKAAMKFRFEPGELDGVPTRTTYVLTIKFSTNPSSGTLCRVNVVDEHTIEAPGCPVEDAETLAMEVLDTSQTGWAEVTFEGR